MTNDEAAEHLDRMNGILRKAHSRAFRGRSQCDHTGVPVDYATPVDAMIDREDEAERQAIVESVEAVEAILALEKLPDALEEMIRSRALDGYRQSEEMWMEWLFADGPHPCDVVKRLYAYVKMKRASLLWNMSFRDLGKLFGESHGTMHARCKVLFGETPAGWRKTPEARRHMAEAQQGNCNRRGGKKARRKKKK